jgi:translation elongation factor EF-Tu-like GTPase
MSTLDLKATFKINSVFSILNRGLVVTGQILNGTIEAGNSISLNTHGELAYHEIGSVEYVDHSGINNYEVGLVIELAGSNARTHLESILGQEIKVFDVKR